MYVFQWSHRKRPYVCGIFACLHLRRSSLSTRNLRRRVARRYNMGLTSSVFPVLSTNTQNQGEQLNYQSYFDPLFTRPFQQTICPSRQSALHRSKFQVRLLLVRPKLPRPKHRRQALQQAPRMHQVTPQTHQARTPPLRVEGECSG